MLEMGRIFINGEKITKPGTLIDPLKDVVEINGKKIIPETKKIYLAMNKPAGYVTTRAHFAGEKSVMSLLSIKNVYPAGRLDKDTEGLLIFTNDGEFANKITHPRFEHDKEYIVHIDLPLTREKESRIQNGIILDNKKTAPCVIKDIKKEPVSGFSLHIIIAEGRKRQIKRMFDYVGCSVIYLKRIRIGKIRLGNLKSGQVRSLTEEEINSI